jgi:DNA-binding MarR family transcriptional regulator
MAKATRRATRRTAPVDDTASWRPRQTTPTSLLFDVFVLGQRARALTADAMRDAGLRPDEYAVYSVVFEEGRVTLTELTRRLGVPLTTAADHVRNILARRHVRGLPHPTDGRASLLTLTASGLRAHRRAAAAFERAHREVSARLGPGVEGRMRADLQTLAEAVAQAHRSLGAGRAGAGPAA